MSKQRKNKMFKRKKWNAWNKNEERKCLEGKNGNGKCLEGKIKKKMFGRKNKKKKCLEGKNSLIINLKVVTSLRIINNNSKLFWTDHNILLYTMEYIWNIFYTSEVFLFVFKWWINLFERICVTK